MDKELKVAVVGVGYLGRHHARIYSKMDNVDLVGVVDSDGRNAERIADQYGTRPYTSLGDLPDGLDAVSVATPTVTHFEIAKHFVEKGVSVLVEKPMTSTLDEARALDALVKESDVVFQVGHIERFNPAMVAIRDMKIEPRFVESHRLAPFKFRATDVGVIMDLMIHDIDIILELCPGPIRRIDAVGGSILSPSEDIANARIEFESGCVVNVTASRVSFKSLRRTRIFSSDCFISLDYEKKYALIAQKSADLDMQNFDLAGIDATRLDNLKKLLMTDLINVKELKLDEYEPLVAELESFVGSVRAGGESEVPSTHGLRAIELAEQVLTAVKNHSW